MLFWAWMMPRCLEANTCWPSSILDLLTSFCSSGSWARVCAGPKGQGAAFCRVPISWGSGELGENQGSQFFFPGPSLHSCCPALLANGSENRSILDIEVGTCCGFSWASFHSPWWETLLILSPLTSGPVFPQHLLWLCEAWVTIMNPLLTPYVRECSAPLMEL